MALTSAPLTSRQLELVLLSTPMGGKSEWVTNLFLGREPKNCWRSTLGADTPLPFDAPSEDGSTPTKSPLVSPSPITWELVDLQSRPCAGSSSKDSTPEPLTSSCDGLVEVVERSLASLIADAMSVRCSYAPPPSDQSERPEQQRRPLWSVCPT